MHVFLPTALFCCSTVSILGLLCPAPSAWHNSYLRNKIKQDRMANEGSLVCLHHSSLILKVTVNRGHFMEQQHCRGLAKKWDAQLQPNPSSLGSTLLYFEHQGINCVVSQTKKMEKQCRPCSVVASSSSSSI